MAELFGERRMSDCLRSTYISAYDSNHNKIITFYCRKDDMLNITPGDKGTTSKHDAKLWDAVSGQLVREFAGHRHDVTAVAFSADERLAGSQVHRFLVLHKELDADDGEITRTNKVRRSFVAERYAPLIEALYDPARSRQHISTEVTFEDGRKGVIAADIEIRDVPARAPAPAIREAAE